MPAAVKRQKKNKQAGGGLGPEREIVVRITAAAAGGALFGLSAPGINQWYLAWIGLVPLFLIIAGSKRPATAFLNGAVFGFAYNLVYLNWYLGLHPLGWLGFDSLQSMLLAGTAWVIVSTHQALIVGLFAALIRLLPVYGGFMPQKGEDGLKLPFIFLAPLAWVVIENKLGNAHDLLGVPWSMIEYSQYKQLPLIQIASVTGGIGIAFLIVMANAALAVLLATLSRKESWRFIHAPSSAVAVRQTLVVLVLIGCAITWGQYWLTKNKFNPETRVAVLQGNINIEMQKTSRSYTLGELLRSYAGMIARTKAGLVVWTESALPTFLRDQKVTSAVLKGIAKGKKTDMVVGSMDRDAIDRPYNSAYGITSGGRLLPEAYHKRYLVPFGEYTPYLVQYMPEWMKRLTNTPAGGGFAAGRDGHILALSSGKVAPLICFETISPELVAESVRNGGELIVNLTDLAWFHDSMVGEQMIAFSVFRAIENRRFFIFAANSGPSAIIEPSGRVVNRSGVEERVLFSGRVDFSSRKTPFTIWFR